MNGIRGARERALGPVALGAGLVVDAGGPLIALAIFENGLRHFELAKFLREREQRGLLCFDMSRVVEAVAEVRLEPVSNEDQSCHSFHLSVSNPTTVYRYSDGFGNRVHHFSLLPSHREVRILSASVVETHPIAKSLDACRATYPLDLLPPDGLPVGSAAGLELKLSSDVDFRAVYHLSL